MWIFRKKLRTELTWARSLRLQFLAPTAPSRIDLFLNLWRESLGTSENNVFFLNTTSWSYMSEGLQYGYLTLIE